jgi:hypothetical protein
MTTMKVTTGWKWCGFNRRQTRVLKCPADWRLDNYAIGNVPAVAVVAEINVRRTALGLPLLELV